MKKKKAKRYRSQESVVKISENPKNQNLKKLRDRVVSYTLKESSPDECSPLVQKRRGFSQNFEKVGKVSFKDRLMEIRRNQKNGIDSVRNSLNLKITNNFLTLPTGQDRNVFNYEANKKPRLVHQKKKLPKSQIFEKFAEKNLQNKISLESFLTKNARITNLKASLGLKKKAKKLGIFSSLGNEAMFNRLKNQPRNIKSSKKHLKNAKMIKKYMHRKSKNR
jgi:hypothetical protein